MLWGKLGLVSYCQKLPKTLVGCTFMRHNSWLCASQLPVVCAQVGKKSMVITRQSMVITIQGNYMPDKNATGINGNNNDGGYYACQPVMRHFMLISCGKTLKSSLLKTTFFSNTDCPVGFFAPAKKPNGTF
jgi:hypothetical protein